MTREEIIYEIRCLLFELDNGEDAVSYLTQNDVKWLKENIKALEQEPKWIPVTERLPDEGGDYLVTSVFEAVKGKAPVKEVRKNYFCGLSQKWLYKNNEVIAWMPLPKPYEAESEGQDAISN